MLYDPTGKRRLYNKTHNLKAYSTEHLNLETFVANTVGLLVVKASQPGSIIGSVVHYGRNDTGGIRNLYAMPLWEPVATSLKGSYNTYLKQGCTLYLSNSGSSNEKVTIGMKQSAGSNSGSAYTVTVPGHGVVLEDICAKAPSNVYGAVTVTASRAKRIYGVIVRKGNRDRYKIATKVR